ncbi:MAG: hypothetical protein IJ629_04115 [Clostridia bacterium]|nr:hypothetical protein [Clostridia bacterium]
MDYYQSYIQDYSDEYSHIAYMAYLKQTKHIIPEFKEMREFKNLQSKYKKISNIDYEERLDRKSIEFMETGEDTTQEFDEESVNHLGHPPLYYHIMNLSNFVHTQDGKITFNFRGIRNTTQFLANIAMIIAFYVGYRKLKSITANFAYAIILVNIPLISLTCSAITNDTLSFIGMGIFIIGAMRLEEKNRNYLTYLLIGLGTFICCFSKLTTSLILFIAYILIIILLLIREKNLKFIFCKQALVTLPAFFMILGYYAIIYSRYGVLNPSIVHLAPEYYKQTKFFNDTIYKPAYTLKFYANHFWRKFFEYWTGFNNGKPYARHTQNYKLVVSGIVFIAPFVHFIYQKLKRQKIDIVNISICIGTFITMIVQFVRQYMEFHALSGFLGGFHSRYYICAMPTFLLLITKIIEKSIENDNKNIKKCIYIGTSILYVGLLQYILNQ